MVARHQDLRTQGRRVIGQQRQQRVRGGTGDDFQISQFLELAEGAYEVAAAGDVSVTDRAKPALIKQGKFVEWLLPAGAMDFPFRQFAQFIEVALVTGLQEGIPQHRAEGWREREREARLQLVPPPALQQLQQRHVGFRDGLKQPVLFQKPLVLRVPDKRQVRMQNERQVAGHGSLESKV